MQFPLVSVGSPKGEPFCQLTQRPPLGGLGGAPFHPTASNVTTRWKRVHIGANSIGTCDPPLGFDLFESGLLTVAFPYFFPLLAHQRGHGIPTPLHVCTHMAFLPLYRVDLSSCITPYGCQTCLPPVRTGSPYSANSLASACANVVSNFILYPGSDFTASLSPFVMPDSRALAGETQNP